MLADGFTFIAQVVNFFILVWLLRRFLFRPIMKAVEAREGRIAASQEEARARKAEAEQEKLRCERERSDFEAAREGLLRKAEAEALARKEEMLARIKAEIAVEAAGWKQAFAAERKELQEELAGRIRGEAFALASVVLRELADQSLDAASMQVLLRKLRGMDAAELAGLVHGVDGGHPVLVKTASEPAAEVRDKLREALHGVLKTDAPIRFETDPGLMWGVELSLADVTLPWSATAALETLQARSETVMPGGGHGT